jgi:arylsulfatase A-like enzyme
MATSAPLACPTSKTEALRLVEQRDRARPFFMHLSHYAVHTPIQAPQALIEKYTAKARAMGLDKQEAIVEGEHFVCQHKRHRRIERRMIQSDPTYAAMVENLDTNLGRVFEALEREGLADDTLVIFTSDNGGLSTAEGSPTCNLPLAEGKGWMYEGGTRVCQIVRWPGRVAAGSLCDVPVYSADFYPTLLEAAGLPLRPRQHVDGVSLLPLLDGRDALDREAIFWHYPHYSNQGGTPACSMRAGDWKLIEFFEDGHLELFNLRQDLQEENNLATKDPSRAAAMHQRLVAWRQEVAALVPQPNPNYQPPVRGVVDPAEV